MCFGGDIQPRQLERGIGGLQGHSFSCVRVQKLNLLNIEAVEIFHADA